jgi:hypothetical protein
MLFARPHKHERNEEEEKPPASKLVDKKTNDYTAEEKRQRECPAHNSAST